MKLIVGLGNIGEKYAKTRHNFGFFCVDHIAQKFSFEPFKSEKKFFGQVSRGQIENEKIVLLKPETYMNLSGKAIQALCHYYKMKVKDVWVLFDDVDLEFGQVRFREKGSSGGHNGIKSIMQALGSDEFPRLKLGIRNKNFEKIPTESFVLSRFEEGEAKKIPEILESATQKFLTHCGC